MTVFSDRQLRFKVAIIWLVLVLVGTFYLTALRTRDMASLAVVPAVPKTGQPIIVTFKLNNPGQREAESRYELFRDGKLLVSGVTFLAANSSKQYQYLYAGDLPAGSNTSFVLKVHESAGKYERMVSIPPFQPQLCSSFVSFAAFSTSVMSSMASAAYYQDSFQRTTSLNVGLICSLVLICLLIFLELSQSVSVKPASGGAVTRLGRLVFDVSTLTWILLIIFVGMVYTKVIMILVS